MTSLEAYTEIGNLLENPDKKNFKSELRSILDQLSPEDQIEVKGTLKGIINETKMN